MTDATQTLTPAATRSGEGEARWWFANLAEIKLTAEQTGGLLSIIEITEPPNAASPLHVHHREDETFWLLDGDATFEVGDEIIHASAGDVLFGPRDVPHRYTVGESGCRMLFIMTPGGFEGLVRDMSVPARSRALPPPSDAEPDWEDIAAVAKKYGCGLVD
jgi:mannose-6-phosphate isomerase-like protein (cupin superfamily)